MLLIPFLGIHLSFLQFLEVIGVHVVGGGMTDEAVDSFSFGPGRAIAGQDLAERCLILAADVALTAPFR